MDRRDYLKTLGATAGVVMSSTPTDIVAPERLTGGAEPPLPVRPVRFDHVVDMVADVGCDSTGREDCSAALERVAADDTLLRFPSGTYLFARPNVLHELTNFGISGEGDTTFKAPPDHNEDWLKIDRGRGLLFENVDLDITAPNAAPTLQLGVTDGLVVRDVEVVGRGFRRGSRPRGEGGNVTVGDAFQPMIRSPDGTGIVENFVAKHGGRIGTYNDGDGRAGIWIGRNHRGTIRLVNCHIAEFPNNGVYASRTYGKVQFVGGTFENNDISQVRLGSEGSFLSNATVRVDVEAVSRPNQPADFLNPRGVWIESADLGTAGVDVRESDITVTNSTPNPPGAIEIERTGGRFRIRNVRVRTRAGPAIIAKEPTGGEEYPPPPEPHWGTIEDVEITGGATEGNAIHLVGRPGSIITGATIRQSDGKRDGIRLVRSPRCVVRNCSIDVGRYPIFVAVYGGMDDTDCLVTVDGMTHLESRTVAQSDRERTALLGPFATLLRQCLTPRMLTDDRDSTLIVSVTDSRFGRLHGVVHSG